jgi:DNA-binding NtrC family response regulator
VEPEPEPGTRVAASDARKHVLVVDDDMLMLSVVERTLAAYRVSTARDGHEALVVLSGAEPVDLLITDYLMPGMTGSELVKRAREAQSGLPVLVITGHGHTLVTADPAWWSAEPHVEKPFHVEELLLAVEKLIGRPR